MNEMENAVLIQAVKEALVLSLIHQRVQRAIFRVGFVKRTGLNQRTNAIPHFRFR